MSLGEVVEHGPIYPEMGPSRSTRRVSCVSMPKRLRGRLPRAHARSGELAKISGYLGKSDAFDQAVANFSIAYADQSERDYVPFSHLRGRDH